MSDEPQQPLVVASYASGEINVWDIQQERRVRELQGHTANAMSLQIYGDVVLSGGLDKQIIVWCGLLPSLCSLFSPE